LLSRPEFLNKEILDNPGCKNRDRRGETRVRIATMDGGRTPLYGLEIGVLALGSSSLTHTVCLGRASSGASSDGRELAGWALGTRFVWHLYGNNM
jgi:hypothetical protein